MDNLRRVVKTLMIALIVVVLVSYARGIKEKSEPIIKFVPVSPTTFEDLLDAIEWVESRCVSNAIGSAGELGSFQIRKIYVDDVNRISGLEYTYDDRRTRFLSREMVSIYIRHYVTKERLGREPSYEDMARIHNGGPNGYKKDCTKPFWQKVKMAIVGKCQ